MLHSWVGSWPYPQTLDQAGNILARDKHSSLSRKSVNYGQKSFIKLAPERGSTRVGWKRVNCLLGLHETTLVALGVFVPAPKLKNYYQYLQMKIRQYWGSLQQKTKADNTRCVCLLVVASSKEPRQLKLWLQSLAFLPMKMLSLATM